MIKQMNIQRETNLKVWAATIFFVGWLATLVYYNTLFVNFDWGYGVFRVFLLAGLGLLCFLFRFLLLRYRFPNPSPLIQKLFLLVVTAFFLWGLVTSALAIREVERTGVLEADAARLSVLGHLALYRGTNPYGLTTILDARLPEKIKDHPISPVVPDGWKTHSHGFRYGPVILLSYGPFIALFGDIGVLVIQGVVLALLCLVFWMWGQRSQRGSFVGSFCLLILLMPPAIFRYSLKEGHTDLLPISLAVMALMLWMSGQDRKAAIVTGLSVAAKTFPGVFLIPLMFRRGKVGFLSILVAVLIYLPFVIWDPLGLWSNFSFPFLRWTDSTSVAHFISPVMQIEVVLAGMGVILFLLIRVIRQEWDVTAALEYVLFASLMAMASGRVFHNNYLVWVIPFMALYVGQLLMVVNPRKDA